MAEKGVKIIILKNKKLRFFLMSQGVLCQKIMLLGQKLWPAARENTDRGFNHWVPYRGSAFQAYL